MVFIRGSRRGLRVVWRAVGAGILNAGANGGDRGGGPQFRLGSVSNVAAGVEASLARAEWPQLHLARSSSALAPHVLRLVNQSVRHRVRKHRAAKQSLRSSYPVHSRTAEARDARARARKQAGGLKLAWRGNISSLLFGYLCVWFYLYCW